MSKTGGRPVAKWQFSNPSAQRAEAALNLTEARELLERVVPSHLREQAPAEPEPTRAGQCFRNVTRILKTVR
jgi:hypothetical protein